MKISIGSRIIDGPYGGGNEFLKNLKYYLEHNDHVVVDNLKDKDIDVILLTNPLKDSETSTFNHFDIQYYLRFINPSAVVFHRINECDERKNTNYVNKSINFANKFVDINIFVSDWVRSVYKEYELYKKIHYVIRGGPNEKIFNSKNKEYWNGEENLKLVTHHWSNNTNKGFETYKIIDALAFKNNFEFTFIGNLPQNFEFKNAKVVKALHGEPLAHELKQNHIYVTASKNEPSGNHHMEGALCGLPVLYINSGALSEYCKNYGVEFKIETFLESLNVIKDNYTNLTDKLRLYPYTSSNASKEFEAIFFEAFKNKQKYINLRNQQNKLIVLSNYFTNKVLVYLYSNLKYLKKASGKLKKYALGSHNA